VIFLVGPFSVRKSESYRFIGSYFLAPQEPHMRQRAFHRLGCSPKLSLALPSTAAAAPIARSDRVRPEDIG